MGDSSWKSRPRRVDKQTIDTLAQRILEHCLEQGIHSLHLELHGGEPLLLGLERMRALLGQMTSVVGRDRITFSLQTNGLLLNEAWVDLFSSFAVKVGVSVDGPPSAHSSRVDRRGADSTGRVLDILARLRMRRPAFQPGVLTVLSDSTDVMHLIDWFPSVGLSSFDLLFPLGNFVTPPVGITDKARLAKTLIDGFDHWFSKGAAAPQIRLYELLVEGFLGHEIVLDSLGGDLRALCVVESDGGIGMNDVVRFLGGKFAADELSIFSNPLAQHVDHFDVANIQELSEKCQDCEVLNACGGGYLPDRFDGRSFRNPSYYCDVLYPLCRHIRERLEASVPSRAWVIGARCAS